MKKWKIPPTTFKTEMDRSNYSGWEILFGLNGRVNVKVYKLLFLLLKTEDALNKRVIIFSTAFYKLL